MPTMHTFRRANADIPDTLLEWTTSPENVPRVRRMSDGTAGEAFLPVATTIWVHRTTLIVAAPPGTLALFSTVSALREAVKDTPK